MSLSDLIFLTFPHLGWRVAKVLFKAMTKMAAGAKAILCRNFRHIGSRLLQRLVRQFKSTLHHILVWWHVHGLLKHMGKMVFTELSLFG